MRHPFGIPTPLLRVRDALELVLNGLSAFPPWEGEDIRLRAEDCLQQLEAWSQGSPSPEDREAMMKCVLGLHIAMAKLRCSGG
jgi:hypothetical protein